MQAISVARAQRSSSDESIDLAPRPARATIALYYPAVARSAKGNPPTKHIKHRADFSQRFSTQNTRDGSVAGRHGRNDNRRRRPRRTLAPPRPHRHTINVSAYVLVVLKGSLRRPAAQPCAVEVKGASPHPRMPLDAPAARRNKTGRELPHMVPIASKHTTDQLGARWGHLVHKATAVKMGRIGRATQPSAKPPRRSRHSRQRAGTKKGPRRARWGSQVDRLDLGRDRGSDSRARVSRGAPSATGRGGDKEPTTHTHSGPRSTSCHAKSAGDEREPTRGARKCVRVHISSSHTTGRERLEPPTTQLERVVDLAGFPPWIGRRGPSRSPGLPPQSRRNFRPEIRKVPFWTGGQPVIRPMVG